MTGLVLLRNVAFINLYVNLMTAFILHYVKLTLLRAAPQDMPASSVLQKILIILYFLLSILNAESINNLLHTLVHGIIDLLMLFVFTYLLLRENKQRINQTFNSFLGVGLVIGVVHTIGVGLFSVNQDPQSISDLARIIFFIIFIWVIVVYAHIIRHAAEVNMAVASCIGLIYIVLNVMMLVSISELLKV